MALAAGELGLLQNILDALEAGRQRLEVFGRPHGLHRGETLFHVGQVVPARRQHGVHFVILEAADIVEVIADAVEHEFLEAADRCSSSCAKAAVASLPSTRILTTPCAARRSANGSREPVGIIPMLKQPRSVSSLSASETSLSGGVARDRILHADRLVVIVDGLRDFFGLALRARVETADDALQLGEFLHHLGGEIALRELRGADGADRRRRAACTSAIMRSVLSR